ncbi:MAG: hypothetical protein D3903_21625 [Candidatus Electrothrix sp. GM3_4]|nr:hypothetical protein [Candidatus Electrothrix sp. GM3_4]
MSSIFILELTCAQAPARKSQRKKQKLCSGRCERAGMVISRICKDGLIIFVLMREQHSDDRATKLRRDSL